MSNVLNKIQIIILLYFISVVETAVNPIPDGGGEGQNHLFAPY